ncbi:MAG: hypothetical protein KKI08_07915, partial [Armatimonadetes bacterium]|nr:hypothetical protein [Armatimonadota bacterium]
GKAIEQQLETISRAEHLGWCAERRSNGWTFAESRNNDRKQHPLLVDWADLPLNQRAKDHDMVKAIPDLLAKVGYMAVRVEPSAEAQPGQADS